MMMHNVTRRDFLMSSGAAAMCALTGVRLATAASSPAASIERFSGFKMGLQSFSLRAFDFEEAVELVTDLGLHWVEFFPRHFGVTADEDEIAGRVALLKANQIEPYVHGVHRFDGNANANRRIFEFARRAGIRVLSAHPTADSFPILDELVKEFDIKIGIHNHGPGSAFDRTEEALEAVEPWDKRIGFCPDTGHGMRSGENPVEMIQRMGDRLYGLHLKDQARIARDNPPETVLGEGAIDLKGVCRALREVGFTAPISLEYELQSRNPIPGIQQGLANFEAAAHATR